ncbi:hypothetical protein Bp8pC_077 [Bacillus phage Bp8p-C]|uniref:Uncharacterized protein n=2 Tax=Agatevirus Bp8pC TaxID=1910937 RepID=A0A0A0PJ59_9CAUD|nr:hypothetical protein AXJ20_gp077 [Bacillus phage Bp8p-C]YP_009784378.1 hypothetical protein QLX39_gp077 [Bacillus phage Bp8p-T]AHJ87508.1 hypothetical protein Bp8pC_077 [Bacillus phage Bp8p-C]AHJ87719.1 hypothetical protein Bp8pT_077 [Bacillus phage Bp8p-T]
MTTLEELTLEIAASLHHGECLYNEEGYEEILSWLDELKEAITEEYNKNQELAEED